MGGSWSTFERVGVGVTYQDAVRDARRNIRTRGYPVSGVYEVEVDGEPFHYMYFNHGWYCVYAYRYDNMRVHVDLNYLNNPPAALKKIKLPNAS
jgi:hypothetical protein